MMPSERVHCMDVPTDLRWEERLVAHRGLAARFPENTLASVCGALDLGVHGVEIDVQWTADCVPFLLHDASLQRMAGDVRAPWEVDLATLRELRATERVRFGERFAAERFCTLAEFAQRMARGEIHAYVELKRESLRHFGADALLETLREPLRGPEGRCTLISFDLDALAQARRRLPYPVGPVLSTWDQLESVALARLEAAVIFCDERKLPMGPLHAPAPLCVYEVSDGEQARRLAARGIARFESFDVERLLRELASSEG